MDKLASWHHFQVDLMLLCIRRYPPYSLSYRDLEEMMLGRRLLADHTTFSCCGSNAGHRSWTGGADLRRIASIRREGVSSPISISATIFPSVPATLLEESGF